MFGTAMGFVVSITFANLVMEDVKERALTTVGVVSKFLKGYVDDTYSSGQYKVNVQYSYNDRSMERISPLVIPFCF